MQTDCPVLLIINREYPTIRLILLVKIFKKDSRKLLQVLLSALHSVSATVLLSNDSQKRLANHFVTFLSDKIIMIGVPL